MDETAGSEKMQEGLRFLAHMIAQAIRRDAAAGVFPRTGAPKEPCEPIVPESSIVKQIRPREDGQGYRYVEIVPLKYFVRDHKKGKNEYSERVKQGEKNVTDQGNLGQGTSAQTGEDQARNKRNEG